MKDSKRSFLYPGDDESLTCRIAADVFVETFVPFGNFHIGPKSPFGEPHDAIAPMLLIV